MCFAPYVSLSTSMIEFLLSIYFLTKNPRDKLNRMIALISFLLGLYQLNEFLICTTRAPIFTILAMSVTAILPALAVSYALIMWRKKLNFGWNIIIYLPIFFFITMFSVMKYYHTSAQCMSIFILYPNTYLIGKFFGFYYLAYLFGAVILFNLCSTNAKTKPEKVLSQLGMLGMFIFTVPTFVFLIFLPSLEVQFASVLCEFALLLAIEFIFVLWYKDKHKISF
ncbi:hypothetical protein HOK76_04095 [archaeon]|nr:hypothetical protein [archaeon]MBT4858788.1 hypothetical protein [archaeon]MBT5423647.1 hypothetical protein [archaeon]MBT6773424.1 hypothetical protein [archaeon]